MFFSNLERISRWAHILHFKILRWDCVSIWRGDGAEQVAQNAGSLAVKESVRKRVITAPSASDSHPVLERPQNNKDREISPHTVDQLYVNPLWSLKFCGKQLFKKVNLKNKTWTKFLWIQRHIWRIIYLINLNWGATPLLLFTERQTKQIIYNPQLTEMLSCTGEDSRGLSDHYQSCCCSGFQTIGSTCSWGSSQHGYPSHGPHPNSQTYHQKTQIRQLESPETNA